MERYVAQETTTPVVSRAYVRRSGMRNLATRDGCVESDDGSGRKLSRS